MVDRSVDDQHRPPPSTPSRRAAPPPPSGSFAPDELLAGRYRIVRFIAQGGMGDVYEAEDRELDERVALKTVRADLARDEKVIDRLKREIQLARRIAHPNVCRVYDLGRHTRETGDGVTFLTMELLTGITLHDKLGDGPLPRDEAQPIAVQMAAGLAAAHEAGVVHRDFKPGNVMLVAPRGRRDTPAPSTAVRAVVMDFGLARTPEGGTRITQLGIVLGTPAYMAPEQASGTPATPASDLWSLGMVLYEMVAGVLPDSHLSPLALMMKRATTPMPAPHTVVPDVDPVWEAVILKCLEMRPEDRFASATEVMQALQKEPPSSAASEPAPAAPSGALPAVRRRGLAPLLAGIVALAAIAAGLGWFLRGRSAPPPPKPVAAPARRAVAVLALRNLAGRGDAAWLSTALAEMLGSELAAGGEIRLVPGETVARTALELGVGDVDTLAPDTAWRMRRLLSADYVVLGSYLWLGEKDGRLRVDLRAQDLQSGETLAPVVESGTESDLPGLAARAGTGLRRVLGLSQAPEDAARTVRAGFPASLPATKLYAEGLARLRRFDLLAARDLLSKAVEEDPRHPMAHAALASAWKELGYETKAREEAQRAFELSRSLPLEEQLFVEGRLRELSGEWERAAEIYRTLFGHSPESLDYAVRLANAQGYAGKAREALPVIESLRKLPPPAGEDARIDLAEAALAGFTGDFRRQADAALRAAGKGRKEGARLQVAYALSVRGVAQRRLGELDEAVASAGEARRIYAEAGDRNGEARALVETAFALWGKGELQASRKKAEEALAVFEEIGNKGGLAQARLAIANVLGEQGDQRGAEEATRGVLALFRELGDVSNAAGAVNNLGIILKDQGRLAEARQAYEESLSLRRARGEDKGVASVLCNLGELLLLRGELPPARERLTEARDLAAKIGDKTVAARAGLYLGTILFAEGNLAGARARYEEAREARAAQGFMRAAAEARLALAEVTLEEGKSAAAEAEARELAEAFARDKSRDDEALARALVARALLAQGRDAAANLAVAEALSLAARTESRPVILRAGLAAAAVDAQAGRAGPARSRLQKLIAEAQRLGLLPIVLEARLLSGALDARAGNPKPLEELVQEASTRGFTLLSRKAWMALGKKA